MAEKKIKDRKDISTLIETLVPEFITAEHPKMKIFIEKYYEFMESHQVYFEGISFNEYKLVQEGIDDASIEPDYWIFEDEINTKLMSDGDPNEFYDPKVLEAAIVNHRIQLESQRDTSKDNELQFIIGETVYGNTTDAEAIITGVSGNTIAFLKPTTNTNFTYGEELTGVDSRAWTTFANGVLAGIFPEGSIEGFRSRGAIAATKELVDLQDIDRTVEGLIDDSWKKEFYTHVPKQTVTDRRKLLKQMKEVYRSKGGESSYDWLFRSLFNAQGVDYYYPKDDLMRLSDGKWIKDKTVKILTDTANNIHLFEGKALRGLTSNATAIVEKTITKTVGAVQVTELYLSKIVKGTDRHGVLGYFQTYEAVSTEPDANNDIAIGFCSGIVENVTIEYGGSNYALGDELIFVAGGGAEAKAEVTELVDDILKGFRLVDSGDGYFVGDTLDFIDGGTGGAGAAATVGTIIPTGSVLKNSNLLSGVSSLAINSNNVIRPLYSNSSLTFTAGIKESSGKVWGSTGPFFTSQFFSVGDLLKIQKHIKSTEHFTATGVGTTLTQTGTTVTLSNPVSPEEAINMIGGKIVYANSNNNIIAGQGNTTTLYTVDTHTIGSAQNFDIYYGDDSVQGTVIGANSSLVLYTLSSMSYDENFGNQTIHNFANNDSVILYDTKKNRLHGALNANASDAALTHTGHTFDIGNTPANVTSTTTINIGDDFRVGGGYVSQQVNTSYNVAPVLTFTKHDYGSINTLAITNGGLGYKRLPLITVANNFMMSLSNSLEHTGSNNSLLNVNLHSFDTGTITQLGQTLTLSGGLFPEVDSNLLHITYANGAENYITTVTNTTSLEMANTADISSAVSYNLTYMAGANTFPHHALIYNDDYSARGLVLDFIDEPSKFTFPRTTGTVNEGTYVEKPGQTGYMRKVIANGNTTLRVDMTTGQDFSPATTFLRVEGWGSAAGEFERLLFEDGSAIYPENSISFVVLEDDFSLLTEDGNRIYGEDVSSDRITAHDALVSTTYAEGTFTQSNNIITGISTIFPNELVRGTFSYVDSEDVVTGTSIITGYTNSTSIIVEDSNTIPSAASYSISYNPTIVYGTNTAVTAVASGTGNRTVTVTEAGHKKTGVNKIKLIGSEKEIFNGTYTIDSITSNTWTYTLPEDTSDQPGTGLSAKFVLTTYLDNANAAVMDTSLKGNNAVIEVASIASGSIKALAVTDVGAGYSSKPRVTNPSGDNNALLTAVIGAFAQYPGKYYGTQGRLDDAPRIQDSRYYQSFSYVLKAPVDTTSYRAHVDRLVHPAGMKMFGELAINLEVSVELFKSGVHAGSDGKPNDVDNYDDSGYELGRPDYLHLHTPRFHPIILTRQQQFNMEVKEYFQPEVEIFTADAPHHAMDGRLDVSDDVNMLREDFRDVQTMVRTIAPQLSYIMNDTLGNDEQYEIGEVVYQGASYFTRARQAEVSGWNHATKTLTLINQVPLEDFVLNLTIKGYISGSDYPILEENTLPWGTITELEHDIQLGDTVQITRATEDYWNGEYVVQTTPTTNTYTVFLGRGDPGENATATAQTAPSGGSWLKVETKKLADPFRASSINYNSPFNGNILYELNDGLYGQILLESGGSFLYPKIQFPEADSGTVSIDMSFSSDLLLEDHINPDTGLHEDGYVLHEAHGESVGMGPTRYMALEDDTEGIQWSHERGLLGHETLSIPYMETTIISTKVESLREGILTEDNLNNIVYEDVLNTVYIAGMEPELIPATRMVVESPPVNFNFGEVEYNLADSIGWHLMMEDEDHFIAEGDETTDVLSRFLTEEGQLKPGAFDVEIHLFDQMGYHLMMEDDSHLIVEGDETTDLARFLTEEGHVKKPFGEVQFNIPLQVNKFDDEQLALENTNHPRNWGEYHYGDYFEQNELLEFETASGGGIIGLNYIPNSIPWAHHELEYVLDANLQSELISTEHEYEIQRETSLAWQLLFEDSDVMVMERNPAQSNTALILEFQTQRTTSLKKMVIDRSGIYADNPMRVMTAQNLIDPWTPRVFHNSTQIIDWADRTIGQMAFGLQVGRPRGPAKKYPTGKYSQHRLLNSGADVFDQQNGQANSIPFLGTGHIGAQINMNDLDRIGNFNQYWEQVSDHISWSFDGTMGSLHGAKLVQAGRVNVPGAYFPLGTESTSELIILESASGGDDILIGSFDYRAEIHHSAPAANNQFRSTPSFKVVKEHETSESDISIQKLITEAGEHFQLEDASGRILLSGAMAIRAAYSNFTTLAGMAGQITMLPNNTAVTGTNTLFSSQLATGSVFQTFEESVILEDDEGIVMESNERIMHEDITMDLMVEFDNDQPLSFYESTPMDQVKWFMATEETIFTYAGWKIDQGSGWDQETKTDTPGSFWLCGETSNTEEEIGLEVNTPNPGGLNNRVLVAENTWWQENIIWEDTTKMLLSDAAEYKVASITNDTQLTVTRSGMDGTGSVPFWKQTTEAEVTATVSGL